MCWLTGKLLMWCSLCCVEAVMSGDPGVRAAQAGIGRRVAEVKWVIRPRSGGSGGSVGAWGGWWEREAKGPEMVVRAGLRWAPRQSEGRIPTWEELIGETEAYARLRMRLRKFRGQRGAVAPQGHDAESITQEAIMEVCYRPGPDGGVWELGPGTTFEVIKAVRRQVDRLRSRKGNRVVRSEPDLAPIVTKDEGNTSVTTQVAGPEPSADAVLAEKEEEEMWDRFRASLGGDRVCERILDCLRKGKWRRREIAAELGLEVDEISNGYRRLKRRGKKWKSRVERWKRMT